MMFMACYGVLLISIFMIKYFREKQAWLLTYFYLTSLQHNGKYVYVKNICTVFPDLHIFYKA